MLPAAPTGGVPAADPRPLLPPPADRVGRHPHGLLPKRSWVLTGHRNRRVKPCSTVAGLHRGRAGRAGGQAGRMSRVAAVARLPAHRRTSAAAPAPGSLQVAPKTVDHIRRCGELGLCECLPAGPPLCLPACSRAGASVRQHACHGHPPAGTASCEQHQTPSCRGPPPPPIKRPLSPPGAQHRQHQPLFPR